MYQLVNVVVVWCSFGMLVLFNNIIFLCDCYVCAKILSSKADQEKGIYIVLRQVQYEMQSPLFAFILCTTISDLLAPITTKTAFESLRK